MTENTRRIMDIWRTDIDNAPKDGSTVEFFVEFSVRAYWDKDLKRWVTAQEHRLNYVTNPKRWRSCE